MTIQPDGSLDTLAPTTMVRAWTPLSDESGHDQQLLSRGVRDSWRRSSGGPGGGPAHGQRKGSGCRSVASH